MVALITGASSGLGAALAHVLAEQGVSLILSARDGDKLRAVASKLPSSTVLIVADLATSEGRAALVAAIRQKQPDLIINNAGFGFYGPASTQPIGDLQKMVEVNVQAVMELSLAAVDTLFNANKKGTVLNISSATAFFPYPTFCVYAATKAFVNSFSQGLDAEVKQKGVRVLTVCPGQIDTSFRDRASRHFPQKKNKMTLSAEHAAELILEAARKGKSLSIIDWRYRILVGLSRLLPKRLREAVLVKSLKNRY
jgi:uncharacterized protein